MSAVEEEEEEEEKQDRNGLLHHVIGLERLRDPSRVDCFVKAVIETSGSTGKILVHNTF